MFRGLSHFQCLGSWHHSWEALKDEQTRLLKRGGHNHMGVVCSTTIVYSPLASWRKKFSTISACCARALENAMPDILLFLLLE